MGREKERLALQKRHTRHDCVFLQQVCRTIDNTSALVLKMLVVCIEAMLDVHETANKGEHGA